MHLHSCYPKQISIIVTLRDLHNCNPKRISISVILKGSIFILNKMILNMFHTLSFIVDDILTVLPWFLFSKVPRRNVSTDSIFISQQSLAPARSHCFPNKRMFILQDPLSLTWRFISIHNKNRFVKPHSS